ncbi:hypothetical protein Agub_g5815 [Astrephomene gubernaculifera]|uniref:Fe2OG dioxygenase domain-containing protein n=1 Tax=Astrephomene gubernaculifera TaxID=47775 RepID=A0AAD3DNV7_9CHLO|nr:hypothetical protein Agub_g5815 [Astrephomene gubernaculifera]
MHERMIRAIRVVELLAICLLLGQALLYGTAEALEESSEEQLIGWRGETYSGQQPPPAVSDPEVGWIETISWAPRAFIYHNFLAPEECDHLISLAKPKLERSQVVGPPNQTIDPIRTSFSASIGYGATPIVKSIEERISRWTHLPISHQEPMEVLRYVHGQKYDAHWDWFDKSEYNEREGNRLATVLMYLSDVPRSAGGETAFPLGVPIDEARQGVEGRGYSECAGRSGIAVRPRKGDVLLFWDLEPDGQQPDRHNLHASCPTFAGGTKWTATKWIHNRPLIPG